MQDTAVLERGGSVDGEQRTVVSDGGISEGDKAFLESNGIDPDTLAEGPQQNSNAKPAEDEYRQVHLRKEHGLFRRILNLFRRDKSNGATVEKDVEGKIRNRLIGIRQAIEEGRMTEDEAKLELERHGISFEDLKPVLRGDVAAEMFAHQARNEALKQSPPPLAGGVQRHPPKPPMR